MNPLARLALWIMAAFVAGVMALAPASATGRHHGGHGHVGHVHAADAPTAAKTAAATTAARATVAQAVLRAVPILHERASDHAQSPCHEGATCAGAAPCCGALWPSAQETPAPRALTLGRTAPPGPPFAAGTDPAGLLRPPNAFV